MSAIAVVAADPPNFRKYVTRCGPSDGYLVTPGIVLSIEPSPVLNVLPPSVRNEIWSMTVRLYVVIEL